MTYILHFSHQKTQQAKHQDNFVPYLYWQEKLGQEMVECVNKCVKCGIVLIKLSPRPIIGQTGGKSFPFWVSVDTGQTICKKTILMILR